MAKKIKLYIYILLAVITIILFLTFISNKPKVIELGNETWAVNFSPTETAIAYGEDDSSFIEFDSNGFFNSYAVGAYPLAGLANYKDNLLLQSKNGLFELSESLKVLDFKIPTSTSGYNMSGVIDNKDMYFFLLNDLLTDSSSLLLLGNDKEQHLNKIEGYVHSFGLDNESIYLLTSNMDNRSDAIIQRLTIDSVNSVQIEKEYLPSNLIIDSSSKIVVLDEYLYYFTIKNNEAINLVKISKDSLNVVDEFELLKYDYDRDDGDIYYPISKDSIFYNEEKIYYPTKGGKVFSFNTTNNEFSEEFSINIESKTNILSYYSYKENELYYFYKDMINKLYTLDTYDLKGNKKSSLILNDLKIKGKIYPSSFIKVE